MAKQIEIKLTSAVVIDGDIVTPGNRVTVDESAAKNLMQRGKAELSTVKTDDDGGSEPKADAKAKAGEKK